MQELPSVARRFLKYVSFNTRSDASSATYPSTEGQNVLLRLLRDELNGLGLSDVSMDEYGYVTASLPSNVASRVPVIGLIAHVDTSPDESGADVRPQLHPDYDGLPLKISDTLVLTPDMDPALVGMKGHTLITTDGRTLLGADDKAGVAEIMALLDHLVSDPSIPHGTLKVAFTPDEEIGAGTKYFDVARFGADFAYTVDGKQPDEIDKETFSADAAVITFKGFNVHPGVAKGKLVSSMKAAARFIGLLPAHMAPETTDEKQGFLHPTSLEGDVPQTVLKLILRDFEESLLKEQRGILEDIARVVRLDFPGVDIDISVTQTYRNMRLVLDKHPLVTECALEAVRRSGLEPKLTSIRGGTDGSNLSYNGLPTPNLGTGGGLYHSCSEWISVQEMEKTVEILTHLVSVWVEKSPA